MTVECPDEIQELPRSLWDWCNRRNYWVFSSSAVYHHGRAKSIQINIDTLTVGDTIGCSVHKDGTLHYYINGIDKGISWHDKLPTNQTMYGVVEVYGCHKRIRSLFHYGKYTSVLTWLSHGLLIHSTIYVCIWFTDEMSYLILVWHH